MPDIPNINDCLGLTDAELLSVLFEHASSENKSIEVPVPEPGVVYTTLPTLPLAEAPWFADEKGQFLLSRVWCQILRYICLEWRYYEKHFASNLQDTVQLVSTLADILVTLQLGIPPVVVSVLLVRRGLTGICHVSRQFSSFEEYLCSLLTSPLFSDAIDYLSRCQLSSQSCEHILSVASSYGAGEASARLLSILKKYPTYQSRALKELLNIFISCPEVKSRTSSVRHVITQTFIDMGTLCVTELSQAIFELSKEWDNNRVLIGILCRVLGTIGDKGALPALEFALQKRKEELNRWGWPLGPTDSWLVAYQKVGSERHFESQSNESARFARLLKRVRIIFGLASLALCSPTFFILAAVPSL